MAIRTTQSAAKLIGKLVSEFLKHTGMLGAFFVVFLLLMILFFVYKVSKTHESEERIMKNE